MAWPSMSNYEILSLKLMTGRGGGRRDCDMIYVITTSTVAVSIRVPRYHTSVIFISKLI